MIAFPIGAGYHIPLAAVLAVCVRVGGFDRYGPSALAGIQEVKEEPCGY